MKPLLNHYIHDEANNSVGIEAEVHRQLEITEVEFGRKSKILRSLSEKKMSSFFSACVIESESMNKVEFALYTKDGARLTVSLSKYGPKSYLGTRGSPVKILTGQNVVELQETEKVERLASKLKCSLFEARTILGFVLLKNTVKKELEIELFTKDEVSLIKDRELSVYSVGFANYIDLGMRRDQYMELLGFIVGSNVSINSTQFPFMAFLGSVRAEIIRADSASRFKNEVVLGPIQTIILKKFENNALSFTQTLYDKGEEIRAKKNEKNMEQVLALPPSQQQAIDSNLIRVDNVFYKSYLKTWLFAYDKIKREKNIMLRDVAPLFSSQETLKSMIAMATYKLGIPLILLAPSVAGIEKIRAEAKGLESKILEEWIRLIPRGAGRVIQFQVSELKGKSESRARAIDSIRSKYWLDLNYPYMMYHNLSRIRAEFYHTAEDNRIMNEQYGLDRDTKSVTDKTTRMAESALHDRVSTLRFQLLTRPKFETKRLE